MYNPLVIGLAGEPQLISKELWITAMVLDVEKRGPKATLESIYNWIQAIFDVKHYMVTDHLVDVFTKQYSAMGGRKNFEQLLEAFDVRYHLSPTEPRNLEQDSNMQNNIPENASNNEDLEFIQKNMTLIAGYAWLGFSKIGRGAIFIDKSQNIIKPNIPDFQYPMMYSDIATMKKQDIKIMPEIIRSANEYDPKTGVVAVFVQPNLVDFTKMRFRTFPTPPEAYEMVKDVLPQIQIFSKALYPLASKDKGNSN